MNGHDIKRWIRCQEFAESLSLTLTISGDGFWLTEKSGITCGTFNDVASLYYFLCGYDQGKNRSKRK